MVRHASSARPTAWRRCGSPTSGGAAASTWARWRPSASAPSEPSGGDGPSAALAGRLALRPTLYTVLGHPDRAQLPEQRAPRALFVTAARRASVTAVLSHASAAALVDSVGRTAVVLPPGVRMERFSPDLRPRTGPLRLLFSASLADRRKRADLAVAVLARVLETHPDARLALSGEGDPGWVLDAAGRLGDKVRAAVDPLGPGSPADVPERYRAASVTLLPSEHEAFGLAVLESMASGTPVVCSPAGGMPELLGDEPVGAVADAATPESLAAAVVQAWELAGRPETPQRCVDRARRWSWDETVGPAHEVLYTRMAAGDRSIAAPGPW